MGFFRLNDFTAQVIFTAIKDFITGLGLSFENLVGQAYDGAAVMAGAKGGLQTLIRQLQPSAIFLHCLAHSLNLVIVGATKNCHSSVSRFFEVE